MLAELGSEHIYIVSLLDVSPSRTLGKRYPRHAYRNHDYFSRKTCFT
jgi:hypothetical protein